MHLSPIPRLPTWILSLCWCVIVLGASGHDGLIQTRDGRWVRGNVRLDTNHLIVANLESASLTPIGATNLRQATFEKSAADMRLAALGPSRNSTDGEAPLLAPSWQETHIGQEVGQGRVDSESGILRIQSGGEYIGGSRDSCYFLYRAVKGRSEVVARILRVPFTSPGTQAGLMIRGGLGPDAPNAFIGLTGNQAGVWQWRPSRGEATSTKPRLDMQVPYWLKLKREGDILLAYESRSGRTWTLVDKISLPLPEEIFVGIAVAGAREIKHQHARGSTVRLQTADIDSLREGPSLPVSSFIPQARLRSGSVVAGRIFSTDGDTIKFAGPVYKPVLPISEVAHLQFQWLSGRQGERVGLGRPGVLLTSGEFVEGEFRGLQDDRVRMSSVLFGLRQYDLNNQVVAVVLRTMAPVRTPYEIETWDGSVWRADSIEIGENEVVIREPVLGIVRIPTYELRSVRTTDS